MSLLNEKFGLMNLDNINRPLITKNLEAQASGDFSHLLNYCARGSKCCNTEQAVSKIYSTVNDLAWVKYKYLYCVKTEFELFFPDAHLREVWQLYNFSPEKQNTLQEMLNELKPNYLSNEVIYSGEAIVLFSETNLDIYVEKEALFSQLINNNVTPLFDKKDYNDYICVDTSRCLGLVSNPRLNLRIRNNSYNFLMCPITFDINVLQSLPQSVYPALESGRKNELLGAQG